MRTIRNVRSILALFGLLLTTTPVPAGERDSGSERQLDKGIIALLAKESTLILVGEVVDYSAQDRYGLALNAQMPFEVKVRRVLQGVSQIEGKNIKVGVTRDEVAFRYKKGEELVFFLKPNTDKGKPSPDPLTQREWRVVSDYFGVQPHTVTLERMIPPKHEK